MNCRLIIGKDEKGNHAEDIAAQIMDQFIKAANLQTLYPSARTFGFNNPDGLPDDDPMHGYERWISIPDDLEVIAPFTKKRLTGGLYTAHSISMGDWEE